MDRGRAKHQRGACAERDFQRIENHRLFRTVQAKAESFARSAWTAKRNGFTAGSFPDAIAIRKRCRLDSPRLTDRDDFCERLRHC
jgi:hypothetical protein